MKTLLTLTLTICASSPARAQQVDLFLGAGTARAGSNGQSIETFSDGTLYASPAMGGVFTNFGASVYVGRQLGIGWTAAWRAGHDYAGLQYHPAFHTFDAIFQPAGLNTKHFTPEFRVGIGLASIHFDYDDPQSCDRVPGCPSSHFFLQHLGFAGRFYATGHIFFRPAVDFQHVSHFDLFGSNWVPRYSISVGYSFGRR